MEVFPRHVVRKTQEKKKTKMAKSAKKLLIFQVSMRFVLHLLISFFKLEILNN